jgi:uncharacterized protein (TIGR03083 family)
MTVRTFASWVEPIAEQLRWNRAEVLAFARAQPEEAWSKPSLLEGWTCKDLLAHIGKGNDQIVQQVLRMVTDGQPIDTSVFKEDTDDANAREVNARRDRPAAEVIDEVEAAGEEMQDLLSRLTEEQRQLRQDSPPFILKTYLEFLPKESHDLEHLAQLRDAMETGR